MQVIEYLVIPHIQICKYTYSTIEPKSVTEALSKTFLIVICANDSSLEFRNEL